MFSFFRRHSKKNDKKQKAQQQSTTNFINDIQCLPIDKYEIAFTSCTSDTNKKPPENKAQQPAELVKPPFNCVQNIMGSVESTAQKPEEHSGLGYHQSPIANTFKCNDYGAKHYDNNNSSNEKSRQEPVRCGKEVDIIANEAPDVTNVTHAKKSFIKETPDVTIASNQRVNVTSAKKCQECESDSKPVAVKADNKLTGNENSGKINKNSVETMKCVVESDKSKVQFGVTNEIPKNASMECAVDTISNDTNHDTKPKQSFTNVDTSSLPQNVIAAKIGSLPTLADDTRPPLSEKTINNSTETTVPTVKNAREIFFNVDQTKTNVAKQETEHIDQEIVSEKQQSNAAEVDEQRSDGFTEIAVEEPPAADSGQEHISEHVKHTDPFSESQYSDSTRCSVDRFSESGRSTDSEMGSEGEEEYEEAQTKSKIQFRPFTVTPNSGLGKYGDSRISHRPIQIPDITITESSDSEGENESECEFEMDCYPDHYYDRSFPTILYDITEVDEPFSDASDLEFASYTEYDERNIVHQESKFQDQIQTLKCEIEAKDTENMQLRGKVNDLQRDITNKTWGMDRLHAELASFQTEADCVRKKLMKVEDDLNCYKMKNSELKEQLLKTLENETEVKKVSALQKEIENLKYQILEQQSELEKLQIEKLELQAKLIDLETDKREKIKTMEFALDETLKQKQKLQAQFEVEYEKLRTVNSDREQQLVNDFEWKLREVELNCKRKIEDKDRSNEEKIKQIKEQLESEIAELKDQLKELEKIKSYEAELNQLRGLTQEQERSLKMVLKVSEQCQENERNLSDEIEKLRSSLDKERNHLATVQGIHSREIAEKDRKHSFRLEQQKNELTCQWEDKIRRETIRLKLELEKSHKEEKRSLLDETKTKAEERLEESNQFWEKKLLDGKKELEILEQTLEEKEESYRKELLRLQTNSDRDMLELRRKLDKMDLSYQEQLEKNQEKHELEIDALKEEYERKMQQSEQNWSQQISSTRATLELVKEQLQRENQMQIEDLNNKYMQQLEEQYEKQQEDKEEAINSLQDRYNSEIYELQNRLNEELKIQKSKESELEKLVNQLRVELQEKTQNEDELHQNINSLQDTIVNLQEKISNYELLNAQSEETLKKQEVEYTTSLAQVRERHEYELKEWYSKLLVAQTEQQSSDKSNDVTEKDEVNPSTSTSRNVNQTSKSRRKNRGKHKNQRSLQNQKHLTKQFSSSSL